MDRRSFIRSSLAVGALAPFVGRAESIAPTSLGAFFDDLQARTFRYFWDTTNPANGLTADRYPHPPFASIAAVGFALTAYPIGVERGWVSRAEARDRTLATLRFFDRAPQGPAASGVTGFKGFFYHFLDMQSGARFETIELSTIDTALLIAGILFCGSYFAAEDPGEAEIRRLADRIYGRVDWRWTQQPAAVSPAVSMGWDPKAGFDGMGWRSYNEGMIVYLLALGSPTFPIEPDAWKVWTANYDQNFSRHFGPLPHIGYPSMFVHQYPHVWVDFRGIRDAYMRHKGFDYFENSRRATLAQQAYAIANPLGWQAYGKDIWGLTACDGPGVVTHAYRGHKRTFHDYTARGPGQNDDGVIAPTAALGSIAFAPDICVPTAVALKREFGGQIYGRYGFTDAFNPSFDFTDIRPGAGQVVPGAGWVDTQYVGIDQGPILAMVENWRSGLIWNVMRRNPHIQRGLKRAGFTGGWLDGV